MRVLFGLLLTGCASGPSPEDCACDPGQVCRVDGETTTCRDLPAACDAGVLDCSADASELCQEALCGDAPSVFAHTCETLDAAETFVWVSCD